MPPRFLKAETIATRHMVRLHKFLVSSGDRSPWVTTRESEIHDEDSELIHTITFRVQASLTSRRIGSLNKETYDFTSAE
jgi:hypothetical protein